MKQRFFHLRTVLLGLICASFDYVYMQIVTNLVRGICPSVRIGRWSYQCPPPPPSFLSPAISLFYTLSMLHTLSFPYNCALWQKKTNMTSIFWKKLLREIRSSESEKQKHKQEDKEWENNLWGGKAIGWAEREERRGRSLILPLSSFSLSLYQLSLESYSDIDRNRKRRRVCVC